MSAKFEQLLDYLVNEEMDRANELFHEIVVEKSREIYENLIAQEEMNDDVEEGMDDDVEEGMDDTIEDSYMMDGDDDDEMGDPTDKLLRDIEPDDEMGDMAGKMGDMDDEESSEDGALMDIKNAIEELEAAFAELEAAKDRAPDSDFEDEEGTDDNEMMGMVREYRETVAKPSGDVAGANTGDKMSAAGATKSPISSGKGKPTTGADAGNILGKGTTHNEDGTSPRGKVGGLVKQGGKFVGNNTLNVDNAQTGIKKLAKVSKPADAEGHAVGAGTGENSVKGATNTKSVIDHKIG
jgi:hypothetical protein